MRRVYRQFVWGLAVAFAAVALAGCGIFGGDDDKPTATSGDPALNIPQSGWDHSPYAVVFRAEVTGGEDADAFYRRNEVPYCTLYGDGRVVWTMETGAGFDVAYDYISEAQIMTFVNYLLTQRNIYQYTAEAAMELATVAPVVEVLTLNVNGRAHTADGFSGWEYEYFQGILEDCKQLGQRPVLFEPVEAWISAQETTYNASVPFYAWSVEATGVDLAKLAETGERQWITGNVARAVWRWIHRSALNVQIGQGDKLFYIGLEVPGITRTAPLPPES